MSQALEVRAEILKLARLLRRDPAQLEYLQEVAPDEIRRLREQVTDVLFTAHGNTLSRLAAASKVLPVSLVATIGERAFGPVLSARIAGMIEPARAVEMASRLPVSFLADVAIEIDPRRASDVIAQIPPAQIAEITRELMRRHEYVTMGRFVGHLHPDAIVAAVAEMVDGALLQVAFVLESKDRLRELIDLLPPARLDGIIDAASSADLWPEALDLLSNLSEAQQAAVAERAAAHADGVLDTLVLTAQQEGMWDAVLPLTRSMSEDDRRRFATLAAVQADGVLEELVRVAATRELWRELLPLVSLLEPDAQARVAQAVAVHVSEIDPEARRLIAEHAREVGALDGPLGEILG